VDLNFSAGEYGVYSVLYGEGKAPGSAAVLPSYVLFNDTTAIMITSILWAPVIFVLSFNRVIAKRAREAFERDFGREFLLLARLTAVQLEQPGSQTHFYSFIEASSGLKITWDHLSKLMRPRPRVCMD
jgi:hypothetical protein